MGIYDRDYIRREPRGNGFPWPETMVMRIVLINFMVYVIQVLTRGDFPDSGRFTDALVLDPNTAMHPFQYYRFLTYGFLHAPFEIRHILFNMFGFWLFGRDVEARYGKKEFLTFYLLSIFIAGAGFQIAEYAVTRGNPGQGGLLGASGGVMAVMVLYAFNWPKRQMLLYFVIPVPMWAIAGLYLFFDIQGAMARSPGDNVAYMAHVIGALFAALYFHFQWNFSQFLPRKGLSLPKRKPKLKVHRGDDSDPNDVDAEVDEILRKIKREGQASLTAHERKTLEEASRKYQDRKR